MEAIAFSPDSLIPFHGYRRLDAPRPLHDLVPTLTHFFESEKFRGVDETLRQEVLYCPSVRTAQKLAKRHSALWRPDWKTVRPYVFRAGLAMQMVQSSEVRALARQAFDRSIELAAAKKVGSLPGAFVSRVLSNLFQASESKVAHRPSALVLAGYEPSDLEARLDALFEKDPPVGMSVYSGPEASLRVEAWCMRRGVAVRNVGEMESRLRAKDHKDLVSRVNLLLLCAPSRRKDVAELIKAAKEARGTKIRLLDYTVAKLASR